MLANTIQTRNFEVEGDPEIGEGTPLLLSSTTTTSGDTLLTAATATTSSTASNDTNSPNKDNNNSKSNGTSDVVSFDETVSIVKEKAVTAVAGVGFVSSLCSLLFYAGLQNPTVYVTGLFGVVLSPYAAIQQRKITEVDALESINATLGEEVTKLRNENERLHESINNLSTNVQKVKGLQVALKQVSDMQLTSVSEIEKQIGESKLILSRMEHNKQSEFMQVILSILLALDKDKDMTFSDEEIDNVIHQMESIQGIELKEQKLRSLIINDNKRKVKGLLDVARKSLATNDPNDPNSFYNFIESTPLPPPSATTIMEEEATQTQHTAVH